MELLLGRGREAVFFLGTTLSSFGAMHFLVAMCFWGHYFACAEGRYELITSLSCGAAVLLCPLYVWAFVLLVRNCQLGWTVLIAGVLLSAAFFFAEVRPGKIQSVCFGQSAAAVRGGTGCQYPNWWWYDQAGYRDVNANPEDLSGKQTARAGY
jgi:hypothetical protein